MYVGSFELFVRESLVTNFNMKLRLRGNMAANNALFKNMKVPELHKFLKEIRKELGYQVSNWKLWELKYV